MDCDDGISGASGIGLRLFNAAIVSSWRAKKGRGERAGIAAHSKRHRRWADRSAYLALGFATPLERRLSENDPRFGVKDRAPHHSGAIERRRGGSTGGEPSGAT